MVSAVTETELHAATLDLLRPVTRRLYQRHGRDTVTTTVHAAGIDLHDGHVFAVQNAPDGTAAPYMVLWPDAAAPSHTRLSGGRSMGRWGFQLTVAAGTPAGVRWALDKLSPLTERAYLISGRTGLLTPYFDRVQILPDEDLTPPRWFVPLRFTTTVH